MATRRWGVAYPTRPRDPLRIVLYRRIPRLSCPELEAIGFFQKPIRPVFKNLLFLSLLAVLGFFGWKHFTAPPPAQTPEEQVSAFVSQSVLPAAELAALCEKHPKLVTEALKGQRVAVSGVLSKALVLGVNSNDLALELAGTPRLKIMFHSQFGKKERWGAPAGFKFQKRGKEIVAISAQKRPSGDAPEDPSNQATSKIDTSSEAAALKSMVGAIAKAAGASKKPDSSQSPTAPDQKTLCREGNTITLRGEFRHISSGWVKCDLLELP
jgi:hypothetical protein